MLIPGVIKLAGTFELIFVNGMGLPFNTGVIIYALLLIGGLTYGVRYTLKKNKTILNTILTSFYCHDDRVFLLFYGRYPVHQQSAD